MKRFVETSTWDAEWFQDLDPASKCLWQFMRAKCDAAGVWVPNWKMASLAIGAKVTVDSLAVFGARTTQIISGILILDFSEEQYTTLNPLSSFHKSVLACYRKHGLSATGVPLECHSPPILSAQGGIHSHLMKGKGKEEVQGNGILEEGCKGETNGPVDFSVPSAERMTKAMGLATTVLHYLNELTGNHYSQSATVMDPIANRLIETNLDLAGVKLTVERQCAKWKNDPKMKDFLRPGTLFEATKFHDYYGQRGSAVTNGHTTKELDSQLDALDREAIKVKEFGHIMDGNFRTNELTPDAVKKLRIIDNRKIELQRQKAGLS